VKWTPWRVECTVWTVALRVGGAGPMGLALSNTVVSGQLVHVDVVCRACHHACREGLSKSQVRAGYALVLFSFHRVSASVISLSAGHPYFPKRSRCLTVTINSPSLEMRT
jgi:hypothetical protein